MADPTNEFTAVEPAAEPASPAAPEKTNASAESAVANKMNEIFGRNNDRNETDSLEEEGLTGPDNPDGDKPETDAAENAKAEEAALAPDENAAKTEEEKAEAEAAAAREKVINEFDPNLRRVAQELAGWKKDDIEDFIASNPTLARITFSNMAAGFNALSLQYAQGVRPGGPAAPAQPAGQVVATPAQVSPLDELMNNPQKLAALSELAGKEVADGFIKPILEERRQMVEDRQFIASLRKEALAREVGESFIDIAKDGFEEFYGKNGETTQDQHNNRFKVAQLGDQIRAGAQYQGVNMSIKEALRRAHLVVTADQTRAQARKEIVKQVKTRSTQITSRPTSRKPVVASTARGDDAAIAAVEGFWNERA